MNIHTFLRNDEETRKLNEFVKNKFEKYELSHRLNIPPDVVLCIGGDGTFLDAVRNYGLKPVFVGINTGTLGFYAEWKPEETEVLLKSLMQKNYELSKQNVLDFEFKFKDGSIYRNYAINEMSFRNQNIKSIETEVWINEFLFEHYRGDGLIISTPSGSTAFNKAMGGSIIDPEFEAIQLTEIGGVNNRVYHTIQNGIIIPKSKKIVLKLKSQEIQMAYDNIQERFEKVEEIICQVSEEKLKTIQIDQEYYWKRVRRSFIQN